VLILINNWLGLIPVIGSIGSLMMVAGLESFVPYLRGGTADLNTTLALWPFGSPWSQAIFRCGCRWCLELCKQIQQYQAFLESPKRS
jgi:hypothetical protein